VIGRGSFGTVYRAFDTRLGVDVALKLLSLPPGEPATPAEPDRILGEARLLARVRHPNVVTVYGADQAEGRVGLWMEMVNGRTLAELLRAQGPFGAHEASIIGRDVCRAVAAVHHAGIVHGDVKAHNIIRAEGGRIVLMDFGAGRPSIGRDDDAHRLAGTPAYLAPEVLAGQPLSEASDIYAVGVLLYHLVTASYPVLDRTLDDLRAAHRRGERRRIRDARPDLPDDFVRAVEGAAAPDPAERFATLGALEEALVSVTSPAAPARNGAPAPKLRPFRLAALVLTGVIAAGGLGAWLVRTARGPGAATPSAAFALPAAASPYEIDAAFYRTGADGERRLRADSQVSPGDELFLKLEASVPLHLYVVNEDERGETFLLFPLPGQRPANPLPGGTPVVVPGVARWQITSAGEREHFLVFASPDRVESFVQAFAALPVPKEGTPVVAPLPKSAIERLGSIGESTRAVGGLTPGRPVTPALSRLFTTPLRDGREQARGLWVRQITLSNPAAR
jgi:serine/threonine-protein kinase